MDHGCSFDELLRRLDALDRRTQELATLVAQKDALIAEQKALIAIQQEQLAAQQVALDRAREQLALFKKAMFGPRRERYVPGPDQQLLFESLPLEAKQSEDAPAAMPESPTKPRRKPCRKFVFPRILAGPPRRPLAAAR
jgi:hypothetical protein